ncbi:MAG: hypothetical protein ACLU0O_05280 [Collinsella sp.]
MARLLGHLDTGLDAQALGLVLTQKLLIAAAKLLELLDLLWRVLFHAGRSMAGKPRSIVLVDVP